MGPDDDEQDSPADEARAITEEAIPAVEVALVNDAPEATHDIEPVITLNEVSEDATSVVEVVVSAGDAPAVAAVVEPVTTAGDSPATAVVVEHESAEEIEKVTEQQALVKGSPDAEKDFLQ